MRTITTHHDGHGLNESIVIEADAQDPKAGGASHEYVFRFDGPRGENGRGVVTVGRIQFQHGPRHEPGSKPGIVEAALLAVLIDRLSSFQAGPFHCEENAEALGHLEAALALVKKRADARAARQVLGKNLR